MMTLPDLAQPADIYLMLRAYAEQKWLTSELLPHLRELERAHAIPDEQLGAALAYLEVLWLDACSRAAETDAAFEQLDPCAGGRSQVLQERARRYYAAVRRLRRTAAERVDELTRFDGPSSRADCASY
jgi:hypothetical protein